MERGVEQKRWSIQPRGQRLTRLMPNLAKGVAKQGAHHVKLKGAELADLLIARVLREEGAVEVVGNGL